MGGAILLAAIAVAIDHAAYHHQAPTSVNSGVGGQSEAGGYGSSFDDTGATPVEDGSIKIDPGAETGGYGFGPTESASDTQRGAGDAGDASESVGGDMEEYYKQLQLDSEVGR